MTFDIVVNADATLPTFSMSDIVGERRRVEIDDTVVIYGPAGTFAGIVGSVDDDNGIFWVDARGPVWEV